MLNVTTVLNVKSIDPHKEIILEALQDYRLWFHEGATESDNSDKEKLAQIDKAINALKQDTLFIL